MAEVEKGATSAPKTGLRAKIRKILPSRETIEAQLEQAETKRRGTTPVAQVRARQRVSLYGVLRSVTYPPPNSNASFSATLFDGTASIDLIWLGRSNVPGIRAGIHLNVQGMVGLRQDTYCVMNPSYQIVADN